MTGLVLGGAASLTADLVDLSRLGERVAVVVGVNDAGYTFPHLDAVATLHPEHVPGWREKREAAHLDPVPWYSFKGPQYGVEVWTPENLTAWTRGSSSLFAIGVAIHVFGCGRVLLAGVPLDDSPNRYRDEKRWHQFNRYRLGWDKLLHELRDVVYSPTGWTRERLGVPEWAGLDRAA